jgi:hypothetical protein
MSLSRVRLLLAVSVLLSACDLTEEPARRIEFLDALPASIVATDPAITIRVGFVTSAGDLATDVADTVHLQLEGPSAAHLVGEMSVPAVDGVASFQLQIRTAAEGLRFSARTTRFAEEATSGPFSVTPGAAVGLDVPSPGFFQAGRTFTLVARIVDEYGNTTPTDTRAVTLTSDSPLAGTTVLAAEAGIARFTDLRMCPSGAPSSGGITKTIQASATGLALQSVTVNVISGPATHLVWATQPTDGRAGLALPEFVVIARDCGGNYANAPRFGGFGCTPELVDNPTGAVLIKPKGGGFFMESVYSSSYPNGNVGIDKPGNGYTLRAHCFVPFGDPPSSPMSDPPSSPMVTPISAPFNVLP